MQAVAKDLWTLRLQYVKDQVEDIGLGSDSESQAQSQSQRELFSSQSETDTEKTAKSRRHQKYSSSIHLIDSLAICYVAVLLLRLPILPGDICTWVQNGGLLFYSTLKAVPTEMKERLPATYQDALEPKVLLSHDSLQNAIVRLASTCQHQIGMTIPPINFPLLRLRCVKSLALPLDVYSTVSRLATMVQYNFTFPASKRSAETRNVNYPMAQLAALLIVAVKLLYPFDGIPRHPFNRSEPAATVVDWNVWTEQAKANASQGNDPLAYSKAMATREADVMSMPKSQIDDYLDWYGEAWATEDISKYDREADFKRGLLATFPAARTSTHGSTMDTAEDEEPMEHLETVLRSLQIREPLPHGKRLKDQRKMLRPGSYYKQWRKEDDIEAVAKPFCEALGRLVGISQRRLVRAVFTTEGKLQAWVREQRKNVREREQLDLG